VCPGGGLRALLPLKQGGITHIDALQCTLIVLLLAVHQLEHPPHCILLRCLNLALHLLHGPCQSLCVQMEGGGNHMGHKQTTDRLLSSMRTAQVAHRRLNLLHSLVSHKLHS
jgi:hypothetical protein